MFAINHAASALLFKKHLKNNELPFIWILIGVQFIELLWVTLNLVGVEKTTTENAVHYVGDIHLSYMPYSHSIISSLIIAFAAGIFTFIKKKEMRLKFIINNDILTHIILDIVTHNHDVPYTFSNKVHLGLSLYQNYPLIAFMLEITFGLFCWWYYGGNFKLVITILLFNLANLSLFFPGIPGPEALLAHQPKLITLVILFQILITMYLVWKFSKTRSVHANFVHAKV
jgi:hypothetical protein